MYRCFVIVLSTHAILCSIDACHDVLFFDCSIVACLYIRSPFRKEHFARARLVLNLFEEEEAALG